MNLGKDRYKLVPGYGITAFNPGKLIRAAG